MRTVLSVREKQCLYWAAKDKGLRGTAEALDLSVETIRSYRSVLMSKLNCSTITGALFVALEEGLLKNGELG